MKSLNNYFKKTQFDSHDTRQLSKNIRQFILDNFDIKVKTKKEASNPHYGGTVTGGTQKTIDINIITKERFDLSLLLSEIDNCSFIYEDGFFTSNYIINISINGVLSEIGEKFQLSFINEDMIWELALNNKSFEAYYIENEEDLNEIFYKENYNNTISELEKFIPEGETFYSSIDFLTGGSFDVRSIKIKSNKLVLESASEEDIKRFNKLAKTIKNGLILNVKNAIKYYQDNHL